jgi:hypothetical protein
MVGSRSILLGLFTQFMRLVFLIFITINILLWVLQVLAALLYGASEDLPSA